MQSAEDRRQRIRPALFTVRDRGLRRLPLSLRKTDLARRPDGIFVAPYEQGEIGSDLFRAACNMGLEGMVSKRRDRPYRAGPFAGLGQGQKPEVAGECARWRGGRD
jgi:hypothetical protein